MRPEACSVAMQAKPPVSNWVGSVFDSVMEQRVKVSREGLVLIKALEGYRPNATVHPDGGWVIGYGHTASAREGVSISEPDAELLLRYDLLPVEEVIRRAVRAPLNSHQIDSLASFGLSIGAEKLLGSDVVRLLNAGDAAGAQAAMERTPPTRVSLDPATRRRGAERALFTTDPSTSVDVADLLLAPPVDPFPLAPLAEALEVLDEESSAPRDGVGIHPVAPFPTQTETEIESSVAETTERARGEAASDVVSTAVPALSMPTSSDPVRLTTQAAPILLQGAFATRQGGQPAPQSILDAPAVATSRDQTVEAAAPLILTPSDDVAITVERPTWSQDQRLAGPIEGDGLFGANAGVLGAASGVSTRPFDARRRRWIGSGPALAAGAIGLAAFGLSMAAFRLFVTRPEAANGSTVVGAWLLAALGLVCVGVATHRLYRAMGERPAIDA